MAVDQTLMDFVVRLATDDDFLRQYQQARKDGRRQMMQAANLAPEAIEAIETGKKGVLENRLNTQVASKK